MPEMITLPKSELERLQERARKLAGEKSYLQLVNNLMNRLSTVPGLESTVDAIVHLILDNIGGVNVVIYYFIDSKIHYADIYGEKKILDSVNDEMVGRVLLNKEFIEEVQDFDRTKMLTPRFTDASYWALPLKVGEQIVGVLKIEGMLLNASEVREQLQPFFNYAALVLKNEIENYSKLKEANEQLNKTNEELKKEVEARYSQQQYLAIVLKSREQLEISMQERKQAEEALRHANAYNRSLIEVSLDPLVTIGPDGKITDVNRATEEATGLSRRELIGTDFLDYFTEPDVARAGYQQVYREGQVRDYALDLKHRDGSVTSVLYNASLYRDEAGRAIGVFAAARDITQRKRAEDTLKESERVKSELIEKLNDAQHLALIGSWEWNLRTNHVWWSDETYQIFGVTPQEFVPSFEANTKFIHPHDIAKYRNAFEHSLQTGEPLDIDMKVVTNDGQLKHCQGKGKIVNDGSGQPIRLVGTIMDISERIKAEEKINHLAAIVESSGDAIISKSLEGLILSWNKGAEQIYGYTAEEAVGKPISILVSADKQDELLVIMARLKQGNKIEHYESVRVRKDGQSIHVSLTISPVKDANGMIVGASIIARDITERKRAEEATRETEEKLRTLLENIPSCIVRFDKNCRNTYVNPALTRIFGKSSDCFLGKTLSEFGGPGEPDHNMVLEKAIKKTFEEGVPNMLESKWMTQEGERIFEVRHIPEKDANGIVVSVVGIADDITERKKAEQERLNHLKFLESMDRINRAMQSAKDLERMMHDVLDVVLQIFECDRAWLVYPCDPEAETWRAPMECNRPEYPGAFALNIEMPIDSEVVEVYKLVLASDNPVGYGPGNENPLPKNVAEKFNEQSQLSMAVYPKVDKPYMFGIHQCSCPRIWTPEERRLFNEIGRRLSDGLTGFLVYRDLEIRIQERTSELQTINEKLEVENTERKRVEHMLTLRSQELVRSNAELEQFAYVASHDLQEPLRMVASFLQLLDKRYSDKLDADAQEFIAYAVDGSKRMQVLTNDLLTYSRIGTKGRPFEQTDCEAVLAETMSNLRVAVAESKAQITHSPLPTVMGDSTQLMQLFQNLIANAIKFRRDKIPEIHIGAELKDDYWNFSVQDNGIGIEPRHFKRIFLVFQRLHNRNAYPGTGIGLAVCKRIVERHGGDIWVESEPGIGTTFYFTIPKKGST